MSTHSIAASYDLPPSDIQKTLELMVGIKQPVIVWGPPGVGKSAICRQVARNLGLTYIDVRVLLLEPVDLRGIPYRDDKNRTCWATPDFLPPENSDAGYLVNLDELASGTPMVKAALYQLILDRQIGEYRLPDGAAIVACSNREEDRAVVSHMPTPLASRFTHLNIQASHADWQAWAAANSITPEVSFFLQFRPDRLMDFDPKSKEKSFPCPRTWQFVSDIVRSRNDLSADVERSLIAGTVGKGAAVEFCSFLKMWREIPYPDEIFDNPANARVPSEPSQLMALCGALFRLADQTNMASIYTYARRLRREVGQFLVDSCVRRDSSLQSVPGFTDWAAHNSGD